MAATSWDQLSLESNVLSSNLFAWMDGFKGGRRIQRKINHLNPNPFISFTCVLTPNSFNTYTWRSSTSSGTPKRLLLSVPKHIHGNVEQGAQARGIATTLKLSPFRAEGLFQSDLGFQNPSAGPDRSLPCHHTWLQSFLQKDPSKYWGLIMFILYSSPTFLHTNLYWHFWFVYSNIQLFWDSGFKIIG